MNRQSAAINGFNCSFALEGDRDRPVVMLSHPLATSMEIWGYQLPLLRARFRVLLYDIRGHGRSAAPADAYTLEALAADVAHLLNHLEIPRVAFIGLSVQGTNGDKKNHEWTPINAKNVALIRSLSAIALPIAACNAMNQRRRIHWCPFAVRRISRKTRL